MLVELELLVWPVEAGDATPSGEHDDGDPCLVLPDVLARDSGQPDVSHGLVGAATPRCLEDVLRAVGREVADEVGVVGPVAVGADHRRLEAGRQKDGTIEADHVERHPGADWDQRREPCRQQPLDLLADIDRARDQDAREDEEREQQDELGARQSGCAARQPERRSTPWRRRS